MTDSSEHPKFRDQPFEGQSVIQEHEPNMWAFIVPFLAFMLIAMLYPNFEQGIQDSIDPSVMVDGRQVQIAELNQKKTDTYIVLTGIQVAVAFGLLLYFRKTYLAQFPVKLNQIAVPIGIIGVVLWIGLCALGIEHALLASLGFSDSIGLRPSFNPFQQIPDQTQLAFFLALRFCLLVLLVPIIEELFLRGWLIRYIENPQWWIVSLLRISFKSAAFATVYGVLTHPSEAVAAFVWFSLVSWLMLRTGSLWDCVIAHSVTNLLLGIYIVMFGAWHLW